MDHNPTNNGSVRSAQWYGWYDVQQLVAQV